MATFERYRPPNLPSLSQQDRIAWDGLANWTPRFEDHVTSGGKLRAFASIAERDAYFTDPQIGDLAVTWASNGDDAVPTTRWEYTHFTAESGNTFDYWAPFDYQWARYAATYSNLTNGSAEAFFLRQGTMCKLRIQWAFTASSTVAANPTFTTAFQGYERTDLIVGGGHTYGWGFLIDDNGADVFSNVVVTATPFTSMIWQYLNVAGTGLVNSTVNATTPFTWALDDRFIAHVEHEMDIQNIHPFTI